MFDCSEINWQKMSGIVPAIVQNVDTGKVLMLGYMNEIALNETLKQQQVIFYSRSKKSLWHKGATSGNTLNLITISADCDGDALLILVRPSGPACHRNTESCFNQQSTTLEFIYYLEKIIVQRQQEGNQTSYVKKLLDSGLNTMAQKVGEEGVEVALAAVNQNKDCLLEESADLLFHLQVLLSVKGCSLLDTVKILQQRHDSDSSK